MSDEQAKQIEALLRDFAAEEPLYASEYDGSAICMYCHDYTEGDYDYDAGKYVRRPVLQRHEPSCLWRRACELLGFTPDRP